MPITTPQRAIAVLPCRAPALRWPRPAGVCFWIFQAPAPLTPLPPHPAAPAAHPARETARIASQHPRSACPAAIARPRGRAAEPGGGARPLASAQSRQRDGRRRGSLGGLGQPGARLRAQRPARRQRNPPAGLSCTKAAVESLPLAIGAPWKGSQQFQASSTTNRLEWAPAPWASSVHA